MRIVHVISDRGLGGAGRYLWTLLEQPAWAGDELTVIAPRGELAARLEAAARGRWRVEAPDLPARSLDARSVWHLARRLRRLRPNVVHAHASLSARLAAACTGVPLVVYTRHGSSRRESAQWQGGRWSFLRRRAEAALPHVAVAVSRAVAEELLQDGVPPARVHVIPSGVDPAPFLEAGARRPLWRARLGLEEDDVLILGTGRLVPEKGWDTWLAAAGRLLAGEGMAADAGARADAPAPGAAAGRTPADGPAPAAAGARPPRLRFAIAGDGPLAAELRAAAARARLPGEVLLGFVEDVPGLLAAADVFMLLSRTEALPLAAVEACMAGRPCVVTGVGGLPEAVPDGVAGFVVPPGDAEAAARAAARLAADAALRARMGEAARRHALAHHSAPQMAQALRDLYLRLLGGRAA
ncbi:MAG: glycosyltransferase family 4 protein [Firmicutes bacterium]|nr:glycosyltransferase family 4 protein [Bacillota bacterium]